MKNVDLISWLPKYLQEYKELVKIMDAENPELELIYNEIEALLKNQFILSCDEKGIARFEKLLGIVAGKNDNLYVRITRVLSRWNDSIPYTHKGLIQKLNILCGEGNYNLNFIHDEYRLELEVYLLYGSQMQELKYMLSYMIPANIIMDLEALRRSYVNTYIGAGLNRQKSLKVSIGTSIEDSIESSFFIGTGIRRNKKITIHFDGDLDLWINQKVNLGVGIKRYKRLIVRIKSLAKKSIVGQFRIGEMKVGEINANT